MFFFKRKFDPCSWRDPITKVLYRFKKMAAADATFLTELVKNTDASINGADDDTAKTVAGVCKFIDRFVIAWENCEVSFPTDGCPSQCLTFGEIRRVADAICERLRLQSQS